MAEPPITQVWHRRGRGRWIVLGALILVAVTGAAWWYPTALGTSSGAPRLVVDRTDVNLGYLRYKAPARVTFTLTNAGDAPLVVKEAPRVIVKAGC